MVEQRRTSTAEAPPLVCPTCGASGQPGPECRRCRSDLRLLRRLENERSAERHTLAQALMDGRWDEALRAAQHIQSLRQDEESFRLLTVCQLLNNQFAAAYTTYRQFRASARPRPQP